MVGDWSVFVMGNEENNVVLQCVPPGQMDTRSVQLYEWRTIDNKIIANKLFKIDVNVNSGRLKISRIWFTENARMFCSAVLPNEERATFTHNLIGAYNNKAGMAFSDRVVLFLRCWYFSLFAML